MGTVFQADVRRLVDDGLSVAAGAVLGWLPVLTARNVPVLRAAGRALRLHLRRGHTAYANWATYSATCCSTASKATRFRRHFPDTEPPATVARGRFEGVVTTMLRRYAERIDDADYRERAGDSSWSSSVCADCEGTRLRPESRRGHRRRSHHRRRGAPAADRARRVDRRTAWAVTGDEAWQVTEPVVDDLRERVRRLIDVGVGYLTLERATPSLSAGEAQRLRLAALLGSGLTGVLYVLDEPTIGLHPADTARLVGVLRRLRDLGNTVLVIEHDLDVLRAADHVIDVGPGGGPRRRADRRRGHPAGGGGDPRLGHRRLSVRRAGDAAPADRGPATGKAW